MDPKLRSLMAKHSPKVNPDLGNGLAKIHLRHGQDYLNAIFMGVLGDFPAGLEFVNFSRCSPTETFAEVTREKQSTNTLSLKRTYDISQNDLYMTKLVLRIHGEEIVRYIYLPFARDGGMFSISGSLYEIHPVLADRVFSVTRHDIFVKLLRDKFTCARLQHNFVIDGMREAVYVVWSKIHHLKSNLTKTTGANTTLVQYLFGKYGLTETFRKYGKTIPHVGTTEINTHNYPVEDWVICESIHIKPATIGNKDDYTPTPMRVAIKRSEFTPTVRSLVGGLFYIVDHFPSRFLPDAHGKWHLDNTRNWRTLLGHIIWSGLVPEGKLYDDVTDHYNSLDSYLDFLIKNQLKELGIHCEDIYDLFGVLIENFSDWLLREGSNVNSMYGKEFSILYYALRSISEGIFRVLYKLKTTANKKELNANDVKTAVRTFLKTGLIFSLTKAHSSVTTVSTSGDNKLFDVTRTMTPQSKATKTIGGRRKSGIGVEGQLHSSLAVVGQFATVTKSNPTGWGGINHYQQLTPDGGVIKPEKYKALLDSVQEKLN